MIRLRVNAIAPGFFVAEQNRALLLDEDGGLTDRGRTIVEFLVALFESWAIPFAVLPSVVVGILGAGGALWVVGLDNDLYTQIGLVLLIGLMAKNSVLLVEFADQLRDKGMDARAAITRGADKRLRPVMMTVVSTILGALPLVLSAGAGAEARSAIGWVIFGGLGIAAIFTLYLTPVLYVLLAPLSRSRSAEADRLARELDAAASEPAAEPR